MRKDIIKTKIKEIEESIAIIKENLPEELENFLELGLIKDGIYKRIEFAIENVIDICAIITTDLDLGVPTSEEDIIENMVKNNILSGSMGGKVKEMKGFRNFLVHRYGGIDDKVAFEIIKGGLEDFSEFIEEIESFLIKIS
jgi:uncharacterized protein YutE (UPF0331/DUF86 family)